MVVLFSCDSNDTEEVRLGTFEADIDGEAWRAEFVIGSITEFMDPFSSEVLRAISITGSSSDGPGERPTSIDVSAALPGQSLSFPEAFPAVRLLMFEGDSLVAYASTEVNVDFDELSDDVAQGTFSATVSNLNGDESIELTNGVFAVAVGSLGSASKAPPLTLKRMLP